MILIADSGSTKTDWALVEGGEIVGRCATPGINPVHAGADVIRDSIAFPASFLPENGAETVKNVFFYGAGCIPPFKEKVVNVLSALFPGSEISVESDLLGAARAVCGREPGMACILGTGSNSCLYDGQNIVLNTPPLGYILGDEGSGAAIGKRFLNAIFKGELPETLRDDFLNTCNLTYADVIDKVYRQPLANRFLAGISLYIGKQMAKDVALPQLKSLITDCFEAFFDKNIKPYANHSDVRTIGAVGSIAYHYQALFGEVAQRKGYHLSVVMKSPIDGLIRFHSSL